MRTKGRRRLDTVLIVAAGSLAAGAAAVGAAVFNEARLERMWVGAQIDADGTAAVHEVIDDNFGSATGENHGIERIVPGLTPTSPFLAFSPTAPDQVSSATPTQVDGEAGMAYRVGDPARTVSGRHRYVLDYRLGTLVDGAGALAFDAVGTAWRLDVEAAQVEVVAPWTFVDPVCQVGEQGSTDRCEVAQPEPGRLSVLIEETLSPGTGVTVRAGRGAPLERRPELPAPPAEPPPDEGAGIVQPAVMALAAFAGAGLSMHRWTRREGRERVSASTAGAADAAYAIGDSEQLVDTADLGDLATTEFAPPPELTAPMGGILLAESVQPAHKVAWLIEQAIAGVVELEEEDGKVERLVRLAPGDDDAKRVLDKVFGGRTSVSLGKYDPTFAKGWAELDELLEGWSKGSGLWDRAADKRTTRVRVLGLVVGVAALAVVGVGGALSGRYDPDWLALVAAGGILAGLGWGAAVSAWELRVRTPRGSALWLRVESFRRFLHESEGYHAEEAAKRGVLREYTAWAVSIGELGRWTKAVRSSSVIPESAGLGYVHLAPALGSSVSSTSKAPSSSGGSGGGGGGGVGGGGGGGGGGNW